MPLEERRVELDELMLGMYVCRLDRPWTETPFPLQGFLIEALSDIELLRRYCAHVYVDVHKSIDRSERGVLLRLGYNRGRSGRPPLPPASAYPHSVPIEEEIPRARPAWESVRGIAARVISDLRAGRRISADEISATIEPIVASVIRNADAFFWIEALRQRDPYAYSHAINCCALATTFGRQLGFPRAVLVDLASGGLLMDLGMSMLSEGLCNHPGPLDADQRKAMQRHVELGLERLQQSGAANFDVIEMIAHHHERHDGSGYPGLRVGLEIPLAGRMLGIVDTFDAMCSERSFQPALSRHHALQALYKQRDRLFQSELIEQFSQCLGVYPTGSLVELSTGEVAVVMVQNPARRLYPRVTILTRPDKTIDPAFRQVDLWADGAADPAQRPSISRALPVGAYGLDLAALFL
jgi:HD-GYP domain-containing protein (c-di-GMP phosphodiesterase class II)